MDSAVHQLVRPPASSLQYWVLHILMHMYFIINTIPLKFGFPCFFSVGRMFYGYADHMASVLIQLTVFDQDSSYNISICILCLWALTSFLRSVQLSISLFRIQRRTILGAEGTGLDISFPICGIWNCFCWSLINGSLTVHQPSPTSGYTLCHIQHNRTYHCTMYFSLDQAGVSLSPYYTPDNSLLLVISSKMTYKTRQMSVRASVCQHFQKLRRR